MPTYMHKYALIIVKLLAAYLVAGAIVVTFIMRSRLDGNAHIPFSGFPEFLIWSPLAPALIVSEMSEHPGQGAISLLVLCTAFFVIAWLLLRRKRSAAA